jgi:hypothetical protein
MIRRHLKRAAMWLFHHRLLSPKNVNRLFAVFNLRSL